MAEFRTLRYNKNMEKQNVVQMSPIDEGKYKGEWLALEQETHRVLAHGAVLKDVLKQAKADGYNDPIIHGVPASDMHFVTIE